MRKTARLMVGIFLMTLCVATSAQASLVFSDNFNAESAASPAANNYTSFAHWNVTGGTVDILGPQYYDIYSKLGQGSYVDLNGSKGNKGVPAGILSTKSSFGAGTYTLQFDLAGAKRSATAADLVEVSIGNWKTYITVSPTDAWSTRTYTFTTTGGTLSFHNTNTNGTPDFDDKGAILDNVKLSSVPLPPSALLFAPALLGLVGLRRTFKK